MLDGRYSIEELASEVIAGEKRLLCKHVINLRDERSAMLPTPSDEPGFKIVQRDCTFAEPVNLNSDLVVDIRHAFHATSGGCDRGGG